MKAKGSFFTGIHLIFGARNEHGISFLHKVFRYKKPRTQTNTRTGSTSKLNEINNRFRKKHFAFFDVLKNHFVGEFIHFESVF